MQRFCSFALLALLVQHTTLRADLGEYLKKPEPAYAWKLKDKHDLDGDTIYVLHLTSQTWQKIDWVHDLVLFVPKNVKPTATMLLWNTGGKSDLTNSVLGLELAKKIQAPVVFLFGIPNQPLFEGKKEDALIAETFVQYLASKDETWPLLLPMAKSVIKAMDAVQEFAKTEWKFEVKQFVISGASKRGWTSWLTGASGDKRVKAIAPLVIDTLNMRKQLPHQIECFGKPSAMIGDYVERKLVPIPETTEGQKLWNMVDPWVYREGLKLPKMIINGTNDPYWSQDALNLYWDDLKGDKWVTYVPNAGHGLEQTHDNNKKDRNRAIGTLCAFAKSQIIDKPMPKLTWKHDDVDGVCRLGVSSDTPIKAARIWQTDATTRDFRQSRWTESPAEIEKATITAKVKTPTTGYRVFFAECEYELDGMPLYLSTQVRIVPAKK